MSNFLNLNEIVKQFQTDPETKNDPIKRMFICDGASISANIASSSGKESKLHTQPDHDEIDREQLPAIEALGLRALATQTLMRDLATSTSLSRTALDLARSTITPAVPSR